MQIFPTLITCIIEIAPFKIKEIAPFKEISKSYSQEWFDREILDKIFLRNKPFQKLKACKLYIDDQLYKEIKTNVEKMIKNRKKKLLPETKIKGKHWQV